MSTPKLSRNGVKLVEDFLDFCDQAGRLVTRGRPAYESDEMLRLAAEALVLRLGEVAARLGESDPQFVEETGEVGWRQIKATRTVVAHKYHRIDHSILWNALETDIPRSASALRAWLAERD